MRELENAIERAVVLSRGNPITVDHLAFTELPGASTNGQGGLAKRRSVLNADTVDLDERREVLERDEATAAETANGGISFKEQVGALERQLIAEALERNDGNRTKAAEELGIYRRLLYAKIKEYGLGE